MTARASVVRKWAGRTTLGEKEKERKQEKQKEGNEKRKEKPKEI